MARTTGGNVKFSIDLLEAARRSSGPLSRLPDKELGMVLDRYTKFLRLIKANPKKHFAPTVDVDDMWHVHMLHPRAYAKDTKAYFGEVLDHNPGFGQGPAELQELRKQFEETSALWEKEFQEPYVLGPTALAMGTCNTLTTGRSEPV